MFVHDTPAAVYGRGLKVTSETLETWCTGFNGDGEEFQKYLLDQTFDNPLFADWSLRMKYRETLIKTIIAWLAKKPDVEVNGRWYELIAEFASRESVEQEWCHTIFLLNNNQFVIHRQTTAMLSHGLTGLSSWPASIFLGDYLMKQLDLLENKRVIELGAGSGLLGLALLKYSHRIPSYTFTDYSPMILNLLRQNASLNFPDDQPDAARIHVEELDWNRFSTGDADHRSYDLIFAADVVYDPSVIESLVKTLLILLEHNRHSRAYIANAIRNPSTYEQFRHALAQSSIVVRTVATEASQAIEILQLTVSA